MLVLTSIKLANIINEFFKKTPIKIQHLKYVLSDYHCPGILIPLEYAYYLFMFSSSL